MNSSSECSTFGSDEADRMSDAARLDHVAIALPRAADAMPWLVGELGGAPYSAGPGLGFRFWQLSFARDGLIEGESLRGRAALEGKDQTCKACQKPDRHMAT